MNDPRSCPNSSLSMIPSGIAPQLTVTKGFRLRVLARVDRLGDHFFPDAALARDQHGDVGRCDLLDDLDDLPHLDGVAEDPEVSWNLVRSDFIAVPCMVTGK